MKKLSILSLFIIFSTLTIFLSGCQDYYTFINVPLSFELTTTFNNPNPKVSQCLEDNRTYNQLKNEISKTDREIVAVAIRTVYDNTNTSGSVRLYLEHYLTGQILIERTLTNVSLNSYINKPYVVILTADERTRVNDYLKTYTCFKGGANVLNVTPLNYNFKLAVDVVLGVKWKATN